MSAQKRLGIIQRVLTPYRAPFFEKLAATSEFDVAVFTGQPMTGETIKTSDSLATVRYDLTHNHYWLSSEAYFSWQTGVIKWLKLIDPDVLVMEANPRIISHWQAIRWMRRQHRPVLGWGLGELERKGSGWSVALRKWYSQRFVRSFDGMIAYSTKAKSDYVALGMASDRVFVAHNSIDNTESEHYLSELSDFQWLVSWREKHELDQKLPIILFVGRLIASKNIDLLIKACIRLFPYCQLLIVGDGPARNDLEQLSMPHMHNVHFLGHQTGKDLAYVFMASDIFVLPAAGGLALHQAMSYGKPVIASFGDGTEADLIRDGNNGFLFQLGDIEDLVHKIEALIFDSALINKMGQESLKIVRDEINLNKMVASFVSAIQSIDSIDK